MENTLKKLLCYFLMASMLLSGITSFALDEVAKAETIFDTTNKDLDAEYVSSEYIYYPVIDGARLENIDFSNKATLDVADIDGESAFKYSDKTNKTGEYYTVKLDTKYTGRVVYSGKMYTNSADEAGNMLLGDATLNINYGSGGANDCKIQARDALNKLKANRWYKFRVEVNLYKDKNHVRYTITPATPDSSGDIGFTLTKSYDADAKPSEAGMHNLRFYNALNTSSAANFVAYNDLKLTYEAEPQKVDTIIDGNSSEGKFKDGILTAIGSGSGLFAIAVYEDNELVSIDFSNSDEPLSERKLNMVIENGENKKVKIFRFDEHNNPYNVNADLIYDSSDDIRIYENDDFSRKGEFTEGDYHYITSDGRLALLSVPSDGVTFKAPIRPRHSLSAKNPGRYLVFEGDYSISEGSMGENLKLFGFYYTKTDGTNGYRSVIRTNPNGNIYYDGPKASYFGSLSSDPSNPTKIKLLIDLETDTFDLYINGENKLNDSAFLNTEYYGNTKYSSKGFYIGHLSTDVITERSTLYLDNLKLYEATEPIDIGNKIPNVHHTDYSDKSPAGLENKDIYERPTAEEIAKKVLNTPHPRVMITSKEVDKIKNSTDANIIAWKQSVMEKANAALSTSPYKYKMDGTSVEDLPQSRQLMMNLGMAYLLTGDMRYPERAYKEAEVMFGIYSPIDSTKSDADGNRDMWNSYSCLDVTEIPQILSICYDWMYDAWTPQQRAEITKHVMEKGIDNMYRNYYGMYLPSYSNPSWWDITNNQGGVCNGSAIITAIAFMEQDAHRCSQIAEAGIRALEIVLKNFYPDGGWMESASYWGYTLEFVTMAACTLDRVCGTNYGLQNAPGLENGCLYSLAIEGETGAMSLGDGSGDATNAPFLFYWASAFKNKDIGAAAMYIKEKFAGGIYDLIYYDANYIDDGFIVPETFYYRGTEMVSLRSGNSTGETYMVMAGGKGHSTGHDHLDSGHVILEMNGERVFKDMGAEHYKANGYFGENRHLYFRSRPESHNIFIINPYTDAKKYPGQDKNAVSVITDPPSSSNKSATIDLSEAYARDAKKAERTISIANDKKAVIEDTITLSDGGDIYWNWYVSQKYKDDTTNRVHNVGSIEISADGKSAVVTKINYETGIEKKFLVTFKTEYEYTLKAETLTADAKQIGYYVNVCPTTVKLHKNNDYSGRIVVNIKGAAGETVNLKTIVESME